MSVMKEECKDFDHNPCSLQNKLVSYTPGDCSFDDWKLNEGKKEELLCHFGGKIDLVVNQEQGFYISW
jgi:hypothetical protein